MKLKNFADHINEAYNPNDERYSKLRSLGLTDEPELDDRMQGMLEEWRNDEEITRLIKALTVRSTDVIRKWFPVDDPSDSTAEEHFQEYIEMLDEVGLQEMGFLEYIALQYYNGYL